MSTATAFKYPGLFPFCAKNIAANLGSAWDHIGNLTLAQVMAFYWNLEDFTLTTSGTAANGPTTDCTGTIRLNPITSCSPFAQGYSEGPWYGSNPSAIAFTSFPAFRQPNQRVCEVPTSPLFPGLVGNIAGELSSGPNEATFDIAFYIGTDPSNAGKYRLYYFLRIVYEGFDVEPGPTIEFTNPARNTGAVLASGTFSLGSLTFNWEATDFGTAVTASGQAITGSVTYFTY